MSITQQGGKDHKTNPRHQKASSHCCWTPLSIVRQNYAQQCTIARRVQFHSRGNLFADLNDNHYFAIANRSSESDHIILLILFLRPVNDNHDNHGNKNFKKAIWNFHCCLGLLASTGVNFSGFTCVKRKRGTVWKDCVGRKESWILLASRSHVCSSSRPVTPVKLSHSWNNNSKHYCQREFYSGESSVTYISAISRGDAKIPAVKDSPFKRLSLLKIPRFKDSRF